MNQKLKLIAKCPRCFSKKFEKKKCSDCGHVTQVSEDEYNILVEFVWYLQEIDNVFEHCF